MSDARSQILGRVRAATGSLPERTPHPAYDPALPRSRRAPAPGADLAAHFAGQLAATGAAWAADWPALVGMLRGDVSSYGYCAPAFVPALRAAWPEVQLDTAFDRAQVDAYAFGITAAWGAIAETGTLILTDGSSPARLAALAPWTHVAVVPPGRIFATVADAVAALPDDPSIVFVTGPSKTADIEGILIVGVHGPGRQIALLGEAE